MCRGEGGRSTCTEYLDVTSFIFIYLFEAHKKTFRSHANLSYSALAPETSASSEKRAS